MWNPLSQLMDWNGALMPLAAPKPYITTQPYGPPVQVPGTTTPPATTQPPATQQPLPQLGALMPFFGGGGGTSRRFDRRFIGMQSWL
jgi:hypothetical protein